MKSNALKVVAHAPAPPVPEIISIETAPRVALTPIAEAVEEAARLSKIGWALLPLGNGEDGKSPSLKFLRTARHPLSLIQNRMQALDSAMFAVRLDGVVVIDADTNNEATRAYIEKRFGNSPYRTVTARGFHSYWRVVAGAVIPQAIRLPGITIDIKSGRNQYVVAPGSTRADGQTYESVEPLPPPAMLPAFRDREAGATAEISSVQHLDGSPLRQRVPLGSRNKALSREAIRLARTAGSLEEIAAGLAKFRALDCEQPETVPNAEIQGIADWAWGKRCANEIYQGSRSTVKIPRGAIDVLPPLPGGCLAFTVFSILSSRWGHRPGEPFVCVPDGLKAAGHLPQGRNQIYDAIELLVETNFLVRVRKGRGKGDPSRFLLGPGPKGQEEREGVYNYIDPFSGDTGAK